MSFFVSWLFVASVQLMATMSPGPAFVVAVRNALTYDRKAGILTAFGLSLGVLVHIIFVLCGISFIISKSVFLFSLIKYAGATYLFYIGVRAILGAMKGGAKHLPDIHEKTCDRSISVRRAVITGLLTNLLNPKAVVFFTAVFSQFITPDTPFFVLALYGFTSVMIEFWWFFVVSIVLTHSSIRDRFMAVMHWVDCVCGGLMIGLGVKLVLSK